MQQTTRMASHMSAVKEVLGLPASDVLLLEEHHKHFFHDQATSSAESFSDEDDPLESLLGATATVPFNSSDEEDLDPLDPADRSSASLADLISAEPGPKRRRSQKPTALEHVTECAE